MTGTAADRAYESLSDLRERLPHLHAALVPGTPRRPSGAGLGARVLARMDELVRAERAERVDLAARGIKVSGEGKAPISLSVLDSERYILTMIKRLEVQACWWLGLTPLAGAEPAARIGRLIGLLGRLEAHQPWIEHVAAESGRLARRAARAMGDDEPVTRFTGRCPLCKARSLRALPERELIFCVNGGCLQSCAAPQCVCLTSGRHVWTYGDAALAELRETA